MRLLDRYRRSRRSGALSRRRRPAQIAQLPVLRPLQRTGRGDRRRPAGALRRARGATVDAAIRAPRRTASGHPMRPESRLKTRRRGSTGRCCSCGATLDVGLNDAVEVRGATGSRRSAASPRSTAPHDHRGAGVDHRASPSRRRSCRFLGEPLSFGLGPRHARARLQRRGPGDRRRPAGRRARAHAHRRPARSTPGRARPCRATSSRPASPRST